MKTLLSIFFFVCLSAATQAQSAQELAGTWSLRWTETKYKMNQAELSHFNEMPSAIKTKVQNSFSSREYSFSSNGNLSVSWESSQGSKTENGTWSLDDNELVLQVNGDERRYTLAMEGELLVLSLVTPMTGATFSKFVLEKN